MNRKTLTRLFYKCFNKTNVIIVIVSIAASYSVTNACNASQEQAFRASQTVNVVQAVNRVADAFELYNMKRF